MACAPRIPAPDTPPDAEERVEVAICIASYRRPEGLAALLDALAAQEFPGARPSLWIVVADNDAEGSARAVAHAPRPGLPPLTYAIESRRGIPHARNAALEIALARADAIAFVDDDEVPDPSWLASLLDAQRTHDADVVTGPVLPRFEQAPPAWVVAGGFFAAPRHPDGTPLHSASTNNALVRAAALRDGDLRFDERFRWMGEDTEFFERLVARGRSIVWADAAVVHDRVPAARTTLGWILARAWRSGRARTQIERLHTPRGAARRALQEAVGSLGRGALAAASVRGERATRIEGLRIAAYAAGRAGGLLGG